MLTISVIAVSLQIWDCRQTPQKDPRICVLILQSTKDTVKTKQLISAMLASRSRRSGWSMPRKKRQPYSNYRGSAFLFAEPDIRSRNLLSQFEREH